MKFGIRQSFEKADQIEDRYAGIKVPVEVAVPYYWEIYDPVRAQLPEIAEKIKSYGTEVLSVHAVQAPLTNDGFRVWGKETAEFARSLGAKVVTLHPNNSNKNQIQQTNALKNLEYLSALYEDDVVFSLETFTGNRRIFSPDEIVGLRLPMTLDVAHISDNAKIWSYLENYSKNIVTVHLSAKGDGCHHLPIDNFCKEVVEYLSRHQWDGNIILEYLYEFHDRILDDLENLMKAYH